MTQNNDINNQYLDSVIQVYFKAFDEKRLYIVYDLQENPRYTSHKFQNYSMINNDIEIQLKSKLRKSVIQDNNSITYLAFLKHDSEEKLCSVRIRPLLSPMGEVIGCVEYYESFNPTYLMAQDKLNESLTKKVVENKIYSQKIKQNLSHRELEILFLLTCNYSQQQIGDVLKISRSTVKSAIENRIITKVNALFHVNIGSSHEMLAFLKENQITVEFSSSLLKNKLIVLNNVLSDFD